MSNMTGHTLPVHESGPPGQTPEAFVDLHCHCLPSLDDGPTSMSESVALCRRLVEDHVDIVVATPHQLGRFQAQTTTTEVRRAVERLNRILTNSDIDLQVVPGAEVRLDERIGQLLVEDEVLTLADMNRHILLELPEDVFIDIEPLRAQLRSQGVNLVIAHPERNRALLAHPNALWRWLDSGVALQVTAASLAGHSDSPVERAAWALVAQGWVAVVATDAHDGRVNRPHMTAAYEMIRAHLGHELARLLCVENPRRVLNAQDLIPAFSKVGQEAC